VCDVPFGCAGPSRASGAVRDVLLAWRCALMVRPGGRVGQLVSNVRYRASGVRIQGVRCCTTAMGSGGRRARRAVENAAATGEVVGAAGGSGHGARRCGAAAALADGGASVCREWRASSMRVWAEAGGQLGRLVETAARETVTLRACLAGDCAQSDYHAAHRPRPPDILPPPLVSSQTFPVKLPFATFSRRNGQIKGQTARKAGVADEERQDIHQNRQEGVRPCVGIAVCEQCM
jgi:hypothetical protein